MNVCVLDDMPKFADKISAMVADYLERQDIRADITTVNSSEELKKLCVDNLDMLLADIDLGDGQENGIQLARFVKQRSPNCQIIFISSFLNYATDVYCAEHVWFLLKDQLDTRLPMALNKAMENLDPAGVSHVAFKRGRERIAISAASIICIESHQRKVLIYCNDRIEEAYASISELEKQLPADKFVRCHNSYIVNLAMVEKYGSKELLLARDICIPVSRQYRDSIKEAFMDYSVMMLGDSRI